MTGPLLNGVAANLEGLGYRCVLFTDSQCRAPDVWTALGAAATETSTALLGPGVTNTLTRDPAVTVSAAATLQMLSGGRAVLAVGRGDSSAHFIGRAPENMRSFEQKVSQLRAYLDQVVVDRNGTPSLIQWLPLVQPLGPIPLELAPSGPKMVQLAARYADRISFAVGSDPEYVAEFLATTRAAVRAAGRDPDSVRYGAWVNVVLNDDLAVARTAVRGTTGIWARFSLMRPDREALPGPLQAALKLLEGYDMSQFGDGSATDEHSMPDSFVDWFAVTGDATRVLARLQQLRDLGLDYLYVVPGNLGYADAIGQQSIEAVAALIPQLSD
ncbi:MAG: LLM class flavin-dependent oxidoreductase [Pseudomonadota bacterium]